MKDVDYELVLDSAQYDCRGLYFVLAQLTNIDSKALVSTPRIWRFHDHIQALLLSSLYNICHRHHVGNLHLVLFRQYSSTMIQNFKI